jgi:hypothetical protein
MSDNNTSTPISADAVAQFQQTAAKYGVSADAVNKTLGAHGAAPVEQPPPGGAGSQAVLADRPIVDTLNEHKHPTLSDRQLEQAAATLTKFWTGDPQVLRDALERAGLQEVDVDDPNDQRGELEKSFDATLGGVRPEEYDLNGVYMGRTGDIDTGGLAEVDRDMRTMLSAIEIPAVMGKAVIEAVLTANSAGWNDLTSDAARRSHSAEQYAIAIRVTGASSYENLISTVKVAVDRIPRAIAKDLAARGVFENGRVLALLYGQGRRLTQRQGLKDQRGK